MTPTYQLLASWLLSIGLIDPPGLQEVEEFPDSEVYLCTVGYDRLKPWERELLKLVVVFGPMPETEMDSSLLDKGYFIHGNGYVMPSSAVFRVFQENDFSCF